MIYVVSTVGRGGIRSVIESLCAQGFYAGRSMRWVASHDEGSLTHRLWLAARAGLTLLWACLRGRAELLHLHSAMRGSFWRKAIYLGVGRAFGVPVVFHVHGSEIKAFHESLGPAGRALFAAALRRADVVVVLSASWRDFILSAVPDARVEIVFNTVPIPAIHAQQVPAPEGHTLRLSFLGFVGERKGIFDLVDVLAALPDAAQGKIRLNVAGNGELDRLGQLLRGSAVRAEVAVLGWVDAQARERLLLDTDVFVLPSYNEGLPMALLEAMAQGVPVISTTVGGIPELVRDGQEGILVQAGDKAALGNAILRLLESPALRTEMGAAARRRVVEQFSPQAALAKLEGIYRRALAHRDVA